ncbi:uncharacterized protein RNJ42_02517 [Nakaseomyces bracarensis]|uniref:uncharacterized protein n=1 Tax=Nakaseomyces bracarensis TaxID=273131 RepID=UPI0038715B72
MNSNGTDIIWMGNEISHLFSSIVVEYSNFIVITTNNNPVLSGNELTSSHWRVRNLNASNLLLCFIVPNFNSTRV